MKELSKYVQTKNSWDKMFNKSFRPLSLIFIEDRQLLARMLSNDLSPENLTCDGEAPAHLVYAKRSKLSTRLNYLCKAFGREISETVAWNWMEEKRAKKVS